MGTLATNILTLSDWARRVEDGGKIASIAEMLNQVNPILDDMKFKEGNLPTGMKHVIRSGLPSVTWRQLNYGVQPSKSRTVQVTDTCGMLEAYSEVDKALADLNGNTSEFRLSEDRAFLEAMAQEAGSKVFYGNSHTDPEQIMGLAPRYSDAKDAENKENIVDLSASGATNTSIWLVLWGDDVHGIFPKGQITGLQHKDLGEVTLEDANKGKYQGYRSHYKWDLGLSVRDWRNVVRCQVDVATLVKDAKTGGDLLDALVQMLEIPRSLSMGTPVIYANRTITSFLRRQMLNKNNVHLNLENIAGKSVMTFDGIPVKKCDALLNTETNVVKAS